MRLFFFPLLLLSFPVFAQLDVGNGTTPCTEANLPTAGGTIECSSLTISNPVLNTTFGAISSPIIVKVTGTVSITNTVNISGRNGTTLNVGTFSQVMGGQGGPGAGDGGGEDGFNSLFPGLTNDATQTTPDPSAGRGGASVAGSATCGDGGGGAGFKTVGSIGTSCGGNGTGAAGGTVTSSSIFSGTLRGGVGGGAGGDSIAASFGGGGGGGGAIKIIAGGDITIVGSITANGGNGGAGGPNGGGGGAGSGGVIWLQSLGNINISGSLSVAGGTGGTATAGGPGGNGGAGFIRLDDADGVITGGGVFPDAEITNVVSSSNTSALKSDITCGTIKPNDKNNSALFQIIAGFMLANLVSFVARRSRKFKQHH